MIVLTLQGKDPKALLAQIDAFGPTAQCPFEAEAITWLRKRGIHCEPASDWETPKELTARLKLSGVNSLNRDLKRPDCPEPTDVSRGPTGRIRFLRSHPRLDAFLTRNQKPAGGPSSGMSQN